MTFCNNQCKSTLFRFVGKWSQRLQTLSTLTFIRVSVIRILMKMFCQNFHTPRNVLLKIWGIVAKETIGVKNAHLCSRSLALARLELIRVRIKVSSMHGSTISSNMKYLLRCVKFPLAYRRMIVGADCRKELRHLPMTVYTNYSLFYHFVSLPSFLYSKVK